MANNNQHNKSKSLPPRGKVWRGLLLLFLFFSFISASASELPSGEPRQRPSFKEIVEKRFDFIVDMLDLTSAKEEQLRPVYMEYCKEIGKLFKNHKPTKPKDQLTEEELEAEIKKEFTRAKKMVNIKEKYYEQFRQILKPSQIETIYNIERDEQQRMRQHMPPRR